MKIMLKFDGNTHTLQVRRQNFRDHVTIDGEAAGDAVLRHRGGSEYLLSHGGKTHRVVMTQVRDEIHVHLDGQTYLVNQVDELASAHAAAGEGVEAITAPMPGTVISVHVAEGDEVAVGDTLMVIESMKLQTNIQSNHDGTVGQLHLGPGDTFNKGALLITVEARHD